MKIKTTKWINNVTLPKQSHYNDVGADVVVPIDFRIDAYSSLTVPLGISVRLPDGYMGLVLPRSSFASRGLTCQPVPIDPGYTGELHIFVTNNSNRPVMIEAGERIGQIVLVAIAYGEYVEDLGEERGHDGFGSTGK